jgi:hypothetical protein
MPDGRQRLLECSRVLHAVQRVDPSEVPNWDETFEATDDHDWTQIWQCAIE